MLRKSVYITTQYSSTRWVSLPVVDHGIWEARDLFRYVCCEKFRMIATNDDYLGRAIFGNEGVLLTTSLRWMVVHGLI